MSWRQTTSSLPSLVQSFVFSFFISLLPSFVQLCIQTCKTDGPILPNFLGSNRAPSSTRWCNQSQVLVVAFHTTNIFCKKKTALAFNWDSCYHLALCLRLILFHSGAMTLDITVQSKKNTANVLVGLECGASYSQ
jgi:hypothetical protein